MRHEVVILADTTLVGSYSKQTDIVRALVIEGAATAVGSSYSRQAPRRSRKQAPILGPRRKRLLNTYSSFLPLFAAIVAGGKAHLAY